MPQVEKGNSTAWENLVASKLTTLTENCGGRVWQGYVLARFQVPYCVCAPGELIHDSPVTPQIWRIYFVSTANDKT